MVAFVDPNSQELTPANHLPNSSRVFELNWCVIFNDIKLICVAFPGSMRLVILFFFWFLKPMVLLWTQNSMELTLAKHYQTRRLVFELKAFGRGANKRRWEEGRQKGKKKKSFALFFFFLPMSWAAWRMSLHGLLFFSLLLPGGTQWQQAPMMMMMMMMIRPQHKNQAQWVHFFYAPNFFLPYFLHFQKHHFVLRGSAKPIYQPIYIYIYIYIFFNLLILSVVFNAFDRDGL